MTLVATGKEISGTQLQQEYSGNLIPVGGGKDSFVTLHLLSSYKDENCTFIINPIISAVNAARAAGYEDGKNLMIVNLLYLLIY